MTHTAQHSKPATLVLGATGKTGRRVAAGLAARGAPVRPGSRSAETPFDWEDPATWSAALEGVGAVYISYYPDLAVPGAAEIVGSFAELAVRNGAPRLVLLAGRGEPEHVLVEQAVHASGADLTILRSAWFMQNFSEGFIADAVTGGEVVLPAGPTPDPFVDAGDVADVAVAALTEDGHAGALYELTGPRLMTFEEAVGQIAEATGREISYTTISVAQYAAAAADEGVPPDFVQLLTYLFTDVLDGRNAHVADGVERALGRQPRGFVEYARAAAAGGAWDQFAAA